MLKRSFVTLLEGRLAEPRPLIQVILGPRQVGKTTGVGMISGFKGRIHYVSADEALIHHPEWILEQWQISLQLHRDPILIIDEIQKVINWSETIKGLWDAARRKKTKIKLVLLGSSSLSLNTGLDESLAGRFELISATHWNFEESRIGLGYHLEDYLVFGGYPEAAQFKDNFDRWQSYLKSSIIESVIGKDILRQRTVRKPALFRQAFEILASYPAQEISYTKLLGQLQEKGNVELVKHYIELFEMAFLFKSLQKYSGSSIAQKSSSPKILPMCPSLYSFQLGPQDILNPEIKGRIFEAAVGVELLKLPGTLFYWRDGKFEVDFIYVRGSQVLAIEVKSGRKKMTSGMSEFVKRNPKAKPIFINPDNFLDLSKNPQKFIETTL
jgi:predicted AAA+ superfamily ATPase